MVPEITADHGIIIVTLPRRFDFDSAPLIENELKPVLEKHPEQVLFDFSKTEYISSVGVRVLPGASRTINAGSGKIALSSLCHQVLYILEIAGFTKIFTIYETRDKAIRHMKRKD